MAKRLRALCRKVAQGHNKGAKWVDKILENGEGAEEAAEEATEEAADAATEEPAKDVQATESDSEIANDSEGQDGQKPQDSDDEPIAKKPVPNSFEWLLKYPPKYFYGFDHEVKKPWRSSDPKNRAQKEFGVLVQPLSTDDETDPAQAKFQDGTIAEITQITKSEALDMLKIKQDTKGHVFFEIQGPKDDEGIHTNLTIGKKKDHKPLLALFEKPEEGSKKAIVHLTIDQIGDPAAQETIDLGVTILSKVASRYANGDIKPCDLLKAKNEALKTAGIITKKSERAVQAKPTAEKKPKPAIVKKSKPTEAKKSKPTTAKKSEDTKAKTKPKPTTVKKSEQNTTPEPPKKLARKNVLTSEKFEEEEEDSEEEDGIEEGEECAEEEKDGFVADEPFDEDQFFEELEELDKEEGKEGTQKDEKGQLACLDEAPPENEFSLHTYA